MLRIGITGGIGSGKSLVCKIFARLDIPVYDADSRAKYVMTSDTTLVHQIKENFGAQAYNNDGSLNRVYLSKQVFNDAQKLEMLNGFVHPAVAADSERWMNENKNAPYTLKEAALLYESGSYKQLDKIIVVTAPESLRVKRVLARDTSKSETDILKIINNQMPEAEKVSRADYVIHNDETNLVIPQVIKLHERFIGAFL
jgi:dephospho-CoA kinase